MKKVYFFVIFCLFILHSPVIVVLARSGCCSHHGGVCGDSCCDGKPLSCVCGGYCGGDTYDYTPLYGAAATYGYQQFIPTPTPISMKANWTFSRDINDNNKFSIDIVLDDVNPTKYSVMIGRYPGSDPGPKADYYNPQFHFNNIEPSRKLYLNVKRDNGGTWSSVIYWEIDTPSLMEVPEVTPTTLPTPTPQVSTANSNSSDNWIMLVLGMVLMAATQYFGKDKRTSNSPEY